MIYLFPTSCIMNSNMVSHGIQKYIVSVTSHIGWGISLALTLWKFLTPYTSMEYHWLSIMNLSCKTPRNSDLKTDVLIKPANNVIVVSSPWKQGRQPSHKTCMALVAGYRKISVPKGLLHSKWEPEYIVWSGLMFSTLSAFLSSGWVYVLTLDQRESPQPSWSYRWSSNS